MSEPSSRRPEDPEAPRHTADSRRGLGFLLSDPGGFRLVLATYDVARTRDKEIAALSRELPREEVHVTVLDLSARPGESSLRRSIEQHLEAHPAPAGARRAVQVTGIEATLDYALPESGFSLFRNANAERERFARIGAISVVLWLDETASATFTRTAPDLWHWRYGGFTFTDPDASRFRAEDLFGVVWSPRIRHHRSVPPERLELLLQRLEQAGGRPAVVRTGHADLLIDLGWAYLELGDVDEAEGCFRDAEDASRLPDDWRNAVLALDGWAVSHRERGDPDQAESFHFRALELAREHGDRPLAARLLPEKGADAYLARQSERAAEAFREARDLAAQLGEPWLLGGALANLVLVDLAGGRPDDALRRSAEVLETFRRLDDRQGEALALANRGLVFSRLGRLDLAILDVTRALAIYRERGDRLASGLALSNLAELHDWVGQVERGRILRMEIDVLVGEVPALGRLRAAPPPVAIVDAPRDNGPMPESRSQLGEAAWALLDELVEREGLRVYDIELRLGWKPGRFATWRRERPEARMEEYFEVLQAITESSFFRLPNNDRMMPSYSDPDGTGLTPASIGEPGKPKERDGWSVFERLFDMVMTRVIRRIQEDRLSKVRLFLWFRDWWRKIRTLVPDEGADTDP